MVPASLSCWLVCGGLLGALRGSLRGGLVLGGLVSLGLGLVSLGLVSLALLAPGDPLSLGPSSLSLAGVGSRVGGPMGIAQGQPGWAVHSQGLSPCPLAQAEDTLGPQQAVALRDQGQHLSWDVGSPGS